MSVRIVTANQGRLTETAPIPIRISEVISALSFALDLTEGQMMGHSVRTCVLGMHIANEIGLTKELRGDLYYALLMKDAGCSSNASRMCQILGSDDIRAKRDVKRTDWTRLGWESLHYALDHVRAHAPFVERVRALFTLDLNNKRNARELVRIRCERGASIARRIGLSDTAAAAIHSLDELWNGSGHPEELRGEEIPLLSRIMSLAQCLDVFHTARGPGAALDAALARRGRWFDPDLVDAFRSLAKRCTIWNEVYNANRRVIELEPPESLIETTDSALDNICTAFADVIDAKSPFTYRHSMGVASAAVSIAQKLSLSDTQVRLLRRAALLHDIGKLGVSSTILDKPGKLTNEEWDAVRLHPCYSFEILRRIPGFGELSEIAASHHEKLDGSGYFRSLSAERLSLPVRILVVSDIYDALAAKRPYRDALHPEQVFSIMWKDAPHALDSECMEALQSTHATLETTGADLRRLSSKVNERPINDGDIAHRNVPSGLLKPNGPSYALIDINGTPSSDGDA